MPVMAGSDVVRWLDVPLRSGQIVLADDVDATSVLLSLAGAEFSPFTHSGVMVIEDGKPYVYEAIGKYPFWSNKSPGYGTRGSVSRTPFYEFMRGHSFLEFYDPPATVDRNAMVAFVRKSYRDAVPFDARFLTDRDRFYCAELVAYALEAGGQPVTRTRFRDNPSLAVLRGWFDASDDWIITTASLVKNARSAGTITSYPSRSSFYAYFAAKRELYRRFTRDQKLGNLFYLDGTDLALRPAVRTFIDLAIERFHETDTTFSVARINDTIRKIAEVYFRPIEPEAVEQGVVNQ